MLNKMFYGIYFLLICQNVQELRVATVRELNRQAAEKLVEVEENILKLNTELMTGTELVDQVNTEVKLCRGQKKVLDW